MSLLEALAALVVHRHPADKIEHIAMRRSNNVVVGLPLHAAGDVAQLCILLTGF